MEGLTHEGNMRILAHILHSRLESPTEGRVGRGSRRATSTFDARLGRSLALPRHGFALLLAGALISHTTAFGDQPTAGDIPGLVAAASKYHSDQSLEPFRSLEELRRDTSPEVRAKLEAGFIQLLGTNSTFEARRFACKQLGIMGSTKALPALTQLLKSDETASIACLALTTYPHGKADSILRQALAGARGKVRVQIIDALGDRRDEKATKLLAAVARGAEDGRDSETQAGVAAIAALGKIGTRAAYSTIVSLCACAGNELEPALAEAKMRCAERFAASGDTKAAVAIYNELMAPTQPAFLRRGAFLALLRRDKDGGEERILATLHGGDSLLEPVAIAAIGRLSSPGASEKFALELPKLSTQAQAWMLETLAIRADVAARSALEHSLRSPDSTVQRAAIKGLAHAGNTGSVGGLVQVLAASKNADDVRLVQTTLVELGGGNETDQALLSAVRDSSGDGRARLFNVLARRQGPGANAVFLEQAKQSDPVVAKAALQTLAKTAQAGDLPKLLQTVAELNDADVRSEAESCAAQALSRMKDSARRSEIVEQALEKAGNGEGHISLLRLLPSCGDDASLKKLQAAAAESDAQIHETAVRALAEWPNSTAWDALAAAEKSESEPLRGVAMHGLARLAEEANAHPDATLMARYRQLVADARGAGELKLILGSLAGAGDPDALDISLPLLTNSDVHAEAVLAVKKIAEAVKAKHPELAEKALKQIDAKP
jgi:HEAT repeat protein